MQESLVRDGFSVKTGPTKQKISHNLARYKKDTKAVRQMLASDWAQKYFLCPIRDKPSNESWPKWYVKSSISHPFLKTFAAFLTRPDWSPLGIWGCGCGIVLCYGPVMYEKTLPFCDGTNPPELKWLERETRFRDQGGEILNSDCSV